MASPKSLVRQLHQHWAVIEHLCRLSRELPVFEPSRVIRVIERLRSSDRDGEPADVLRALCANDLLQTLSRSDDLQINPLVLDFVRGLTREHELGLSAVLKARVEAIRDATRLVEEGIAKEEMDSLREGTVRLAELLRQIARQLDQDRHAIMELAEKAKASEASIPIARRYRSVLEAYDQYVEPMNEMMDSGLGGTFYPYLEQAVHVLDRAEEYLSVRGALYTQRLQLRHVSQQAKELRRLGRLVAQQCADTLLPLRDEARQHNTLSTAVSELLGQVRKQGLRRVYYKAPPACGLPGWQRTRRGRLQLGDEILELMAQARNYAPEVQSFPESVSGDPQAVLSFWVDEKQLRLDLKASLPVENLMQWLQSRYPHIPDAVVLRLYHDLVRDPEWRTQLQYESTSTDLQHVRVIYHPHRLFSLATEEPVVEHEH
ncbi:hypothetical protein [Nitrincola alkalilacustris]|uniref:hypothetical protein n=1 Tax=Nitrincola alkalilacustris TaxID=1571224 RepID=UPI00124F181A|nr:hypothetical protein [Nitrincola alkalilacustris]